jgi:vitamin B12/bleomycin/antimicrobial peptide transport system ATP-binding/permease protein
VRPWDKELTPGEQERLGYARLILRRPEWLICDDGLDPLDDANRTLIRSILEGELAATAVINIADSADPAGFYSRTVRLVARPAPAGLSGAREPAADRQLAGAALR